MDRFIEICLYISLILAQTAFAQNPVVITTDDREPIFVQYVDIFGNRNNGFIKAGKGKDIEINTVWPLTISYGKNTAQSNVMALPGDTIRLRFDEGTEYGKVINKDSIYNSLVKLSRIVGLSTTYHSGFDIRKTEISDFEVVFHTIDSCYSKRLEMIERYTSSDSVYKDYLNKELEYYRFGDLLRPYLSANTNTENIPVWYTDSIKVLNSLFIDKDSLYMGGDEYRMALVNYNKFLSRDSFFQKSDTESFYILFRSAQRNFKAVQRNYLLAWVLQKYKWANLPDFQIFLNKFYEICREESFLSYIVDKIDNTDFKYPTKILESTLTTSDGSKSTWQQVLNKYHGKVVLIDMWASWCGPCYFELPYLKKLKEQYGYKEFEIIALSIDQDEKKWKTGLSKYKKAFPNNEQYLVGLKKRNKGGLLQFLLTRRENEKIPFGIPRYVLLDQEGKNVISEVPGPRTDQIHKLLRAFLPENDE